MAYLDSSAFPVFGNIPDDSTFVHRAMAQLGFVEFSELSLPDMQLTLALASHLKRMEARQEVHES